MPDQITYIPNFDYEKDYSTTGTVAASKAASEVTQTAAQQNTKESLSRLLDNIKRIQGFYPLLPDDLYRPVAAPVAGIRDALKGIKISNLDLLEKAPITYVADDAGDSGETGENEKNEFFSDTVQRNILTVRNKISAQERAIAEYDRDLIEVFDDFANKLRDVIANYTNSALALISVLNSEDLFLINQPYTHKASDIENPNLLPVSDFIVKSQIVKDQKMRLLNKVATPLMTIKHLRACKVSSELRVRYAGADYANETQALDVSRNKIISQRKADADKKYEENFLNLYKYLNTIVIFIEDYLRTQATEDHAKAVLIKEGVIQHASKTNE